jgi:hypothetical protein
MKEKSSAHMVIMGSKHCDGTILKLCYLISLTHKMQTVSEASPQVNGRKLFQIM